MKPNFKIVECDVDPLEEVKPDFITLYNSEFNYTRERIMELLNLSRSQYSRLVRHCAAEGLIKVRRGGRKYKPVSEYVEDFVRLYNNKNKYYSMWEIINLLGINSKYYCDLVNLCSKNGLIVKRKAPCVNMVKL